MQSQALLFLGVCWVCSKLSMSWMFECWVMNIKMELSREYFSSLCKIHAEKKDQQRRLTDWSPASDRGRFLEIAPVPRALWKLWPWNKKTDFKHRNCELNCLPRHNMLNHIETTLPLIKKKEIRLAGHQSAVVHWSMELKISQVVIIYTWNLANHIFRHVFLVAFHTEKTLRTTSLAGCSLPLPASCPWWLHKPSGNKNPKTSEWSSWLLDMSYVLIVDISPTGMWKHSDGMRDLSPSWAVGCSH